MKLLSTALTLVGSVQAGLRFPCSTLTVQRLDPVVEPGNAPSAHVHHIVGGNAFNASMSGDVGERATCTTCQMAEDFSNYWTAQLYFKHPTNGSYKRVPTIPVQPLLGGSNGATGGLTVYYTQFDLSRDNLKQQPIKAFQPGFRMTVGSPTASSRSHIGLSYQCMTGTSRGTITSAMPDKPCSGGIFTTHHFPPCWDGKNLDSPNHQDHMYDTSAGGFQVAGPCPKSHPVRVPQLAYETLWNTTAFNDKSLWPTDGSQPFVWSMNDNQGYGSHGDYVFGWQGDSLQAAMNSSCMFQGCGNNNTPLKAQGSDQMNKCKVKPTVTEETEGWLTELPGQKMNM